VCSNVRVHTAGDSVRDHKVAENYPSTLFFSSQDANTIRNDSLNMGLLEAGWQLEPESLYYFVLS